MARVQPGKPPQGLRRRPRRRPRRHARRPRRRVPRPRRPLRLRQEHDAAHDRRTGGHHRRPALHRRPARQRRGAKGPRHRDGLPELRPLPPHERLRQHRLRAQAEAVRQGRDPPPRGGGRRPARHRRRPGAEAEAALGGAAAARGRRAGHRAEAGGVPLRRAPLQPRRQAPRPDPDRALEAAPPLGHDDDLRHPRPGGGDDDGGPDRGLGRGTHPAGRHPPRPLRTSGQPLRGRLHRQPLDELHPGPPRERAGPPLYRPRRGVLDPARWRGRRTSVGLDVRLRGPRDHAGHPARGRPRGRTSAHAAPCRRGRLHRRGAGADGERDHRLRPRRRPGRRRPRGAAADAGAGPAREARLRRGQAPLLRCRDRARRCRARRRYRVCARRRRWRGRVFGPRRG